MKGFKNAFAAGALGIILAATGCQAYMTETNDLNGTTTRGITTNRGVTRSNRVRTTENKRLNSAGVSAVNRAGRRSAGLNRSNTIYNTGNVTRNAARNTVGSTARTTTGNITGNTAGNFTRNTTNNFTRSTANSNLNRTGSPFGDYNKDRAFSGANNAITNKTGSTGNVSGNTQNVNNAQGTTAGNLTSGTTGTEIANTARNNMTNNNLTNNTTRTNAASNVVRKNFRQADANRTAASTNNGAADNLTVGNTYRNADLRNNVRSDVRNDLSGYAYNNVTFDRYGRHNVLNNGIQEDTAGYNTALNEYNRFGNNYNDLARSNTAGVTNTADRSATVDAAANAIR